MKAASYLQEALLDPAYVNSEEPTETAFNLAFKTDLSLWDWFELSANEKRRVRFGIAMEGSKQAVPPTAILEGKSDMVVEYI